MKAELSREEFTNSYIKLSISAFKVPNLHFCLSILSSANLRKKHTYTHAPGEPTRQKAEYRVKRCTGSCRFNRYEALRYVHTLGHGALTDDIFRLQKEHGSRVKRWGF